MGSMQAQEFADLGVELETALSWHARSNHYPPLPHGVVPLMVEAIDACNNGDFDHEVDVSSIGSHRVYGTLVPASACAEAWHLDAWIDWS